MINFWQWLQHFQENLENKFWTHSNMLSFQDLVKFSQPCPTRLFYKVKTQETLLQFNGIMFADLWFQSPEFILCFAFVQSKSFAYLHLHANWRFFERVLLIFIKIFHTATDVFLKIIRQFNGNLFIIDLKAEAIYFISDELSNVNRQRKKNFQGAKSNRKLPFFNLSLVGCWKITFRNWLFYHIYQIRSRRRKMATSSVPTLCELLHFIIYFLDSSIHPGVI